MLAEQNIESAKHKTDEELVVLSLASKNNYQYLMQRYEKKLLRYIMSISNFSHEDAEDVLQDVFIKAFRKLNGFDKNLQFSSWIYRITHNETISHFRKKKTRPQKFSGEINEVLLDFLKDDSNIEKEIINEQSFERVRSSIDALDAKYKAVLVLKYIDDKSYQEISDILKKPVGTVATLLNRAKKQFAKKYKDILI